MKNSFRIIAFLILSGMVSFKTLAQMPKCLAVDMPMSKNANDVSGNGYDGTVYGAILAKDRNGVDSSAYYFDGKNDYIEIDDPELLNKTFNQISISVWFKPEKGNFYNTLVAHNGSHLFMQLIGSNLEPAFYIQKLTFDYKGAKEYNSRLVIGETISTSTWTHMVCTFDSATNNISVYLNAKLVYTGQAKGYLKNDKPEWRIGNRNSSGFEEYFKGYIDEVRMFTCAIDSNDVKFLYYGKVQEEKCKVYISNKPDTSRICSYNFQIDSLTSQGIPKYEWNFGDGTKGKGFSAQHQYQKQGAYKVTLTLIDSANKCTTAASTTVIPKKCGNGDTSTACLVMDYPLNANANDLSGNQYNGTVYGATLAKDRFGNDSMAYYFDGSDDYIEIADPDKINKTSSKISISMWYKPEKGNYYNTLIAHSGSHLVVQLIDQDLQPAFYIQKLTFDAVGATTKNSRLALFEKTSTSDWTHMVFTFDSAQKSIKVYLNGILKYSGGATGFLRNDFKEWRIGGRNSLGFEETFKGSIDDVKLYRCVLNDKDVEELFNAPNPKPKCKAAFVFVKDTTSRCTFKFESTSTDTTEFTKYQWNLADGTLKTGQTVNHSYGIRGDYEVSLIVKDSTLGCKSEHKAIVSPRNCIEPPIDTAGCETINMPFDANVLDFSQNNYHGKNIGALPAMNRYLQDSTALFFSGNDYVEIVNADRLNNATSAISFSTWYYPTEKNEYNTLIAQGNKNLLVQLVKDSLKPAFFFSGVYFKYKNAENFNSRLALNYNSQLNTWTHLVCTFDSANTEFKAYINGKLLYSGKAFGSLKKSLERWRIGGRYSLDSAEFFSGNIDDLQIFRCVLDSNEVKLLYDVPTFNQEVKNPVISTFPNPNNGSFYVQGLKNNLEIEVFSIDGRKLVYKSKLTNAENTLITLESIKPGVYFIVVKDYNGQIFHTEKLILN